MALTDCDQCWETPCICGYEYRHWSAAKLRRHIDMLGGVLQGVEAQRRLKPAEPEPTAPERGRFSPITPTG